MNGFNILQLAANDGIDDGVDGRIITSKGPGTAMEFALTLVAALRFVDFGDRA